MKTIIVGAVGRWGYGILHLVKKFSKIIAVDFSKDVQTLMQDEAVLYCVQKLSQLQRANIDYNAELMIIAIPGQYFRKFLKDNIDFLKAYSGIVVLQMKALEVGTGKTLTEIWDEIIGTNRRVVLVGPVHSEYLVEGKPVSMVLLAEKENQDVIDQVLELYKHPSLKLRIQHDVQGGQIGSSLKNPVGIMVGVAIGSGYESLVGDLITRSLKEVSEVIVLKGGQKETAYGLSHLGDYAATAFCDLSHNRKYGEFLATGSGKWRGGLVEGIKTTGAFWSSVSDIESVEKSTTSNSRFPLFRALYGILFEGYDIEDSIKALRAREIKEEF
jgi:glycerol-3-phosphate dehydrogenase (NAD(P)+)